MHFVSDLSIPKRLVRVSVTSAMETVEGFLFLADQSEHSAGAERVGHILNQPERFLPIREARDERVFLYNKNAIQSLTVLEPGSREWEVEELEFSPAEKVEITLVSGAVLRGITYLDPRPEKSRVSDLVNRPEKFIPLVREEGVTYVAKKFILRVG